MRSFSFQQSLALVISIVFAASVAYTQDLGSSNKLFGKPAATSKPATTKKAAKKVATPKIRASASTTAKAKTRKPLAAAKKQNKSDKVVIASRIAETTPIVTAGNSETSSRAIESQFDRLVELGNRARNGRDYREAESAFTKAKLLKPKDARSFLGFGDLYADQHRWEDAEAAYRKAVELDADNASSLVALSFVLTRPVSAPDLSDRFAEAERLARRVLKSEPQNSRANDQLGVALELRGEIGAETESAYRRSIQFDQTFAPAYAHLGRLLRKKGRAAESATAYANAMTRSGDVPTRILVAEILQSEGRVNEAIQLLDLAIASDPRNPAALSALGRALTSIGNYADAERTLKKSIEISPATFVAYSLLGSLYIRQEKFEAAESALKQSMSFVTAFEKRRLATQFEAIGDGYAANGKSTNAMRIYKLAISLDPDRDTLNGKLKKFR